MPRTLDRDTIATISTVHKQQSDRVAPALGAEMIAANLPLLGVAALLRVSAPTALRWMKGETTPKEVYHRSIRKLTAMIRKAKRDKVVPLTGSYPQRMIKLQELVATYRTAPTDGN